MGHTISNTVANTQNAIERNVENKIVDSIINSKAFRIMREVFFYFGLLSFIIGEILCVIFGILALTSVTPFVFQNVSIGATLLCLFITGLGGILTTFGLLIGFSILTGIIATVILVILFELLFFVQIIYKLNIIDISKRNEWAFGWYFSPLVTNNRRNNEVDLI
jgi:hypothetical protein